MREIMLTHHQSPLQNKELIKVLFTILYKGLTSDGV